MEEEQRNNNPALAYFWSTGVTKVGKGTIKKDTAEEKGKEHLMLMVRMTQPAT